MSEDINTPTSLTRARKRRQGKRLTQKERKVAQDAFLAVYADCANIRASCAAAGIDRSTFYQWTEHEEHFSMRFNQVEKDANDMLLSEAWRRGVTGVEEPVVSMGQVVYDFDPVVDEDGNQVFNERGKPVFNKGKPVTVKKYSDSILTMLIKAKMPEYREKGMVINNVLPKEYNFDPNQDGVERQ